jgi:hypothetical protein
MESRSRTLEDLPVEITVIIAQELNLKSLLALRATSVTIFEASSYLWMKSFTTLTTDLSKKGLVSIHDVFRKSKLAPNIQRLNIKGSRPSEGDGEGNVRSICSIWMKNRKRC